MTISVMHCHWYADMTWCSCVGIDSHINDQTFPNSQSSLAAYCTPVSNRLAYRWSFFWVIPTDRRRKWCISYECKGC